jgi:putative transposase
MLFTPRGLYNMLVVYMPGRRTPLITKQIYHIFNRGVAEQPTFLDKKDYDRALETILFYRNTKVPLRYSYFIRLPQERRFAVLNEIGKSKDYLVEIIAYCLMPNHFHLLLKQVKDDGISNFMSNVWNSYTRYFNTKRKRTGPVFQGSFKAVRIESENQLLHVQRYIHLNPYSSYLIKNLDKLTGYYYSSLSEYLKMSDKEICNKNLIMAFFKDINSYREFIFNQADYQRRLQDIKHLVLESL